MKRRLQLISLVLTIAMLLSLSVGAFATEGESGPKVRVSPQKVILDGEEVTVQAYNIDGYNYFKLRDLAALFTDTGSSFSVDYDAETRTITVATGGSYEPLGTELETGEDLSSTCVASRQTLVIDGIPAEFSVYNIGGYNYFKIRDAAGYLKYGCDYDEANNTAVLTSAPAASGEWETARAEALTAIAAANLPTAEELETKEFTIAGAALTEHEALTWTAVPPVDSETQISIADYEDVAAALADAVSALADIAPEDWSVETDEDFADYLAFAAAYAPVAEAAKITETRRVYIAAQCANAVKTSDEDPDAAFESAIPYHIYTQAIEVGVGPMDALRVADCIPSVDVRTNIRELGPDYIGNAVYDVHLNKDGVVVAYDMVQTDSVLHYKPEDGSLNISYFAGEVFPIADGAKLYYVKTETEGSGRNAVVVAVNIEEGSFAELTEDWNDTIRAVFNDDGAIVEAYINPAEGAGEAPAYISQINKFTYYKGVTEGFDTFENPYAVDYALYNPLDDPDNTTATDANAKYPLFVFFHGNSGGVDKNALVTNNNNFGLMYSSAAYQAQFKTDTEDVHGCYILLPRGNNTATKEYNEQSWLTGWRGGLNPLYASGEDVSREGRPVQVAAVLQDILHVLEENPNIDRDRIYITGFSAGGYMTWQTLLASAENEETAGLFAAAVPGGAALFPDGAQLPGDVGEFVYGLRERLLAVKDTPIWEYHSIEDNNCQWWMTAGDPVDDTENWINGWEYLPQMVRSFATGETAEGYEGEAVKGSPLTRVSIFNYLHSGDGTASNQHAAEIVEHNNLYDSGVVSSDSGTEIVYFDKIYSSEKPEGYNAADATPGSVEGFNNSNAKDFNTTDFGYSVNETYSTQTSWNDTLIDWLNTCGDVKAGIITDGGAAAAAEHAAR